MYAIEADVTYAFRAQGVKSACDLDLILTEPLDCLIIETENPQALDIPLVTSAKNIDQMKYVNTKIVFVQQLVKKQIKDLYHEVLTHKRQLKLTQSAHFGFQ